ncbi:M28 family peptidase [Parvularcula sp. ZS-1/3]|uniref:M28 family peptidase n=1 Tax=Parvularcula mediterranea TaxID=2732508 RepID=A0A7Y3RNG8_9PROT|nr:M28 family peptidase [Parvularcula mediterranea]NNU17309.1 M28 family peptidase [Parvularcula mediterranea]
MVRMAWAMLLVIASSMTAALASPPAADIQRTQPGPEAPASMRLEFDTAVLSDDLMEGREAGKRGHDFAAQFVAERFRSLGLTPVSATLEYFQLVPVTVHSPRVRGGAKLWIEGDLFEPGLEIVGFSRRDDIRLAHAPIVFVNYGLVSKRYRRDDYKGIDVRGAIVVAIKGAPSWIPADERAWLTSQQAAQAEARGAAAFLSILPPSHETDVESFADLALKRYSGDRLVPASARHSSLLGEAVMGRRGAEKLFTKARRSFAQHYAQAERSSGQPKPVKLKLKGSMRFGSRAVSVSSPNVVGIVPGIDPYLAGEAVVVTAHLDHLGRREGEMVFDGALDNAAGVAALLELAKDIAEQPARRTIIFAATTGGEHDLLGSDYLAANPVLAGSNVVANVNLDMPLVGNAFSWATAHGARRTSLAPLVSASLSRAGVREVHDPLPEQGFFTRSDHYSFMRRGIPSVYLVVGGGDVNRQRADVRLAGQPSDPDQPSPLRFDELSRYVGLHQDMVREIADADLAPRWNEEDVFATLFNEPAPAARTQRSRKAARRQASASSLVVEASQVSASAPAELGQAPRRD